MPTLLDLQDAVYRSLVERDDGAASRHVWNDGLAPEARLSVYRNTFVGSLTTALRLSYPAVHRLVGAPFFESAARIFIEAEPPHCAHLNRYGAEFPDFLARFQPAASLPYLPGVARLEWAVNVALHAPDVPALDLLRFSTLDPAYHERLCLAPHPSVSLVRGDHPIDAIWRAVLAQDEAAMASLELGSGPVWLLVDRQEAAVDVRRIDEHSWRFMSALCAGRPVPQVVESFPELDGASLLAEHLAAGRFSNFKVIDEIDMSLAQDILP